MKAPSLSEILPDRNTIKLLRIPFSFFLMPVFCFSLSQTVDIQWGKALIVFLILHLLVYPASNGYNSYMDNDEGSIGGLRNPPKPTRRLFWATFALDILAVIGSWWVGVEFLLLTIAYVAASRAYSYKGIRLKKYPIIGFVTVVIFQGAVTFLLVMVGASSHSISQIVSEPPYQVAMIASSVLIGGVYPLTQVYQHEQDAKSGDITISYRLGYTGTFIFSSIMFLIANILLYIYFLMQGKTFHFFILQGFMALIGVYFVNWFLKVLADTRAANFDNTMKMNQIAATAMNVCFLVLLVISMYSK